MTSQPLRPADHVAQVMNHAWLALLLSLGERLGLHDVLADLDAPAAADQIAQKAGCDARYVEEWAWGMRAGGLLESFTDTDGATRFALPDGYAPALTARGGPAHWSRITTQITALAGLENPLVEAFRTGSGLGAEHYEGRIAEVLAGESGPIFETVLLTEVIPLLGIGAALEQGVRVLDLGCGTGQALEILARAYPRCRFTGVDQSTDAIASARARTAGLRAQVDLLVADIETDLPAGPFDLVMAANVVHDLSDPVGFLRRAHPITAPGGTIYLHELGFSTSMEENVADPHALGVITFGLFHCLPLAKRRPGIAPGGMWGSTSYRDALTEAGFENARIGRAPSDPNNDTIFARRRAA